MNTEQVEDIKKDIKRYKSIVSVLNLEGGKLLLKTIKKDVQDDIEGVISLYGAPELELRAKVAKLKADLALLQVLTRSKSQLKLAMDALTEETGEVDI
jgi:hypothetical protein